MIDPRIQIAEKPIKVGPTTFSRLPTIKSLDKKTVDIILASPRGTTFAYKTNNHKCLVWHGIFGIFLERVTVVEFWS